MKVLFFWEPGGISLDRSNPYAALLGRALLSRGIEFEAGFRSHLSPEFLEANRNTVDVLHFNWPSGLYADPDPRTAVAGGMALLSGINHARSLGMRVVWTMHNLYPHDSALYELDRLVRLGITSSADSVIVHCEHAREQLRRHFFRAQGVFTIPHGNFIDAYPNTLTRAEARSRLGIDRRTFVYLFFGTVRANKGVEKLVEAFRQLPGDDCLLLLAARIASEYGDAVAQRACEADPRILVHRSSFYRNEEFQLFYNAADIAVLSFTDILTSGSAITALSLGCPVLVPAIGCLPELVTPQIALTYDPSQPQALLQALEAARRHDLASCRSLAIARMRDLDWGDIARRTLQVYRSPQPSFQLRAD